jgi:hypothetical protein
MTHVNSRTIVNLYPHRAVDAETGFGLDLASSAGSKDHNVKMQNNMNIKPKPAQILVSRWGKTRKTDPVKNKPNETYNNPGMPMSSNHGTARRSMRSFHSMRAIILSRAVAVDGGARLS